MLNGILLSFTSAAFDGDPRFIGFSQAKKMGGHIKKGEKATPIFRPIIVKREDDDGEESQVIVGFKTVMVFNVNQTNLIEKGIIPEAIADNVNADSAPITTVMDFVGGIDFKQIGSNGCPNYSPLADNVGMPSFAQFHTAWKHSESLLHELIHWTGHPSRLNRLPMGWSNKADYSREELVACMGAALMLNHLGVSMTDEIELNQTAYLQGWISFLKNDISILLNAAQDAAAAANYLIQESQSDVHKTVEAA